MKPYKNYEIYLNENYKGQFGAEAEPLWEVGAADNYDGRIFTAWYPTEIEALAMLKSHIDKAVKKRIDAQREAQQ